MQVRLSRSSSASGGTRPKLGYFPKPTVTAGGGMEKVWGVDDIMGNVRAIAPAVGASRTQLSIHIT